MALGKMLRLGGIDNSSPKTDQTPGTFRVARNVQPTPDGRIIPRHSNVASLIGTYDRGYLAGYSYDAKILELVSATFGEDASTGELLKARLNGVNLPFSDNSFNVDVGLYLNNGDYSQAVTTYRRNNTVYFHIPWGAYLIKYDGVEMSKAGTDGPKFSCAQYDPTSGPLKKYVKVIKHTIDFDTTENASESVTFPILATTVDIDIYGYDVGGGFIVGGTDVTPEILPEDSIGAPNRFIGSSVYQAGTNDILVTTTSTNIDHASRIGSYVIVASDRDNILTFPDPIAATGLQGFGLALKVKSISPLVLDMNDAKLYNFYREWETFDFNPAEGASVAAATHHGYREFISVWASPTKEGVYSYQGFQPLPIDPLEYYSVHIANPPSLTVADVDRHIIILSPTLNDFYDVTSTKKSPNSFINSSSGITFGITGYLDSLVMYDDDLVYFSDYTLGGTFEMFNLANLARIGDKQGGRIMSVCGTQTFLFVSRVSKNYYLSGDVSTGNYSQQEITGTELGAWCNNASINIKDSVIFLSPLGVFQVSAGGRVFPISSKLPRNFSTFDNYTNPTDDVVFKIDGFGTNIQEPDDFGVSFTAPVASLPGLAVGYDEHRELLVFLYKDADSPALVVHTKTGESYEWNGLGKRGESIFEKINTVTFVNSVGYFGGMGELLGDFSPYSVATRHVEDKTQLTPDYVVSHPVLLYSSWTTAGEPSLEKQLLQLKMFGRISTTTANGLTIVHWKDWRTDTAGTFSDYFPDVINPITSQIQYSHKKRLDSDKVLAASVGLGIFKTGVTFELESLEIEFMPIQTGMKK